MTKSIRKVTHTYELEFADGEKRKFEGCIPAVTFPGALTFIHNKKHHAYSLYHLKSYVMTVVEVKPR